ncbi:hypothetical protein PS1M3_04100 [Pseudoalteromonas sp. PS1M3]|uniref:hypothetical protein n=1 Tax=Pseudoalteromonas sp. PS1M3 TaxID=87791 RepID=UPI00194F3DF0|nr:hypothetical protein [Pseudoalteromonas sp. PS1M3]BBW90323.1 hypothetical protein PS1M3_04100 [Pseudoalteromonas sp. PS1M3]
MKKLLLVCPDFYDYKSKIESELLLMGYDVTSVNERPRRYIYSFIKRFFPKSLSEIFYNYYFCTYLGLLDKEYDEFLCIRGEVISEKFLKKLIIKNPNIRRTLYQWDSNKVVDFLRIVKYFDKIKTFDFADSKNFGLEYLPLFCGEEYNYQENIGNIKYDLVYVASFNNERYKTLKNIKQQCERANISYYFHLYISLIDFIKLKILSSVDVSYKDVKFQILSRNEVASLNFQSKAILDIENIMQSGFTMRTFESLASGRLLITTNSNIRQLTQFKGHFYALDRENLNLPVQLIKNYQPKPPSSISDYTLNKWLRNVLN